MRRYLCVAALALLAFGATLSGGFHFDDPSLWTFRAVVERDGWRELFRAEQTRPLTVFTFWLNHLLGGRHPAGYHAVNLALHVLAATLLLRAARRVLSARAAWIAACLFAVHPLATEPVAYVFARPALLMTVGCLLSLDEWLRDRRWRAAAWFAAALLAKEECAAFPVFLLLLDWSRGKFKAAVAPAAAMLGLALAAGLRVVWALSVTPGAWAGSRAGIGPGQYLAVQGPVILRYLRQFVLPWGFSIDPQIGPYAAWEVAASWAAVAALAAGAMARFRHLQPGFWVLGGLVLLLPSSSIFPASDLAADRRMYLPLIGWCAAAAILLERFDRRRVATAAIVAVFAGISIRYSTVWNSEEALWSEAVERAPAKVRPRIHLARAVDAERALAVLGEAQNIAPRDPDVASEQGRVLLQAGRAAEALGAFGRALALEPGSPQALQNRGAALLALGQADAARQDFERALERDPCLFEARLNLRRMGVAGPVPPSCRWTPDQEAALAQTP